MAMRKAMKKNAKPGLRFTLIVFAAIYCFAHNALLSAGLSLFQTAPAQKWN